MKHTSLYDKIEEIRRQEIAELIAAVNAHGGRYEWPVDDDENDDGEEDDDENKDRPIIAINPDNCCPNPQDVEVISVSVNSGKLELEGVDKNDRYDVSFTPEEVFIGHLSFITDYIPETDTVSDVSLKRESFKISSVSREDLEEKGFDTDGIDDSEMERLASKLGDDYCEQLFWGSMEIIAEHLGFPRKCDTWFKGCDFTTMEKLTGFKQTDYSPEDGYQDFVDACEDWWEKLRTEEREEIYTSNN
ncbi:MAG: hypothetical protein LBI60_04695 [Bacteroidales bacterium]|jgi:hypothetical protein|nr:hypothetical protein [Bacteroidales bacterium]